MFLHFELAEYPQCFPSIKDDMNFVEHCTMFFYSQYEPILCCRVLGALGSDDGCYAQTTHCQKQCKAIVVLAELHIFWGGWR